MMVKQTAPYLDSLRAIDLELLSAEEVNKRERYISSSVSFFKGHKIFQAILTCFDGDPVGTSVGLEVGETDGPLLGLWEGDKLGLDVGCGMIRKTRTK